MAIAALLDKLDEPEAKRALTAREAQFVGAYELYGCNGSEAMRRLGYGGQAPEVAASRMMAKPWVQAAIAKQMAARAGKVEVSIERLRAEFALHAFQGYEGPFTASHKLDAMKVLGAHLGFTKQEQAIAIPVTFQFVGGPALPDPSQAQVIDHASPMATSSAAILGPDKPIPR